MKKLSEKKRFSTISRIRSSNHAFRGFVLLLKTCHNFWGHIFFGALAVYLGIVLKISNTEWLFIIFIIGLVFVTEAINSTIEVDLNLTSQNFHPLARDAKDMSAGAVLVSVFLACLVGLIIFLPKIFALYF